MKDYLKTEDVYKWFNEWKDAIPIDKRRVMEQELDNMSEVYDYKTERIRQMIRSNVKRETKVII